ncbi:MAG: hypothetical protein ACO22S_04030 [Burkholderiaceae bacterium]
MATIFPTSPPVNNDLFVKGGQQWKYSTVTNTWTSVATRTDNSGTGAPLFGAYDIRDDLFAEWNNNTGTIQTYNGAGFTNTTSYATTKWFGDNLIQVGLATGVTAGPGFKITVPAGYDTVWIRRHQSDPTTVTESLYEYAWNSADNVIGRVRNWGNRGLNHIVGPSGFRHHQFNEQRHNWTLPMHLPDRLGGTIFIASLSQTGMAARDTWFGGFAFSRNDRNLTATNVISGVRGDYGGYSGGTWSGEYWGQPAALRPAVTTTAGTELQKFGMPCLNSGKDKILVLTMPRANDGDDFYGRPWLEVVNTAGTVRTKLSATETAGVDLNPVSEAIYLSSYIGVSSLSFRVPASALTAAVPVSSAPQEVRFRCVGGDFRRVNFNYSQAFLFDA